MSKFGQVIDGVFTGKVKDFNSAPDPNPAKGASWLPYVEQADPVFDPDTQELTAATIEVVGGQVVRSRAVSSLSAEGLLNRALAERRAAYHSGTLSLKGVQGDQVMVLGFWMDAIVEELIARGPMVTVEMQALEALRAQVKTDNPKP